MSIDRRNFIKSSLVAPLGAHFLFPAQRKDKPNLLFIWTDQQRPDTMAVYGNSKIHAPNLNRFASESTVFQRQYVTQPVCTPSRSSVMTGLWPHGNGCTENNIPLGEKTPCFPEILADSDYRTGYFGSGTWATKSSRNTALKSGRASRTYTASTSARTETRSARVAIRII
jgi:arylsulfatase A-like enzyme